MLWGGSRVYLEETLRREGGFSAALDRDASDLQKILGLGVKEAREMRDDIVSKAYRCAGSTLLSILSQMLRAQKGGRRHVEA